nr:THUMP domain-containing protein 1 [Onthophagus taurus]
MSKKMYKHSKRAKYTSNNYSSKSGSNLEPGMKGFLCTFNNREKECIREAYNVLNKYADELYGPETLECDLNPEQSESNIEDDLEKELKELKAKNVKKKRFQVVKSGAKNVLFVRTTIEDPVTLATLIMNELKNSKSPQTRFLYRLIPIQVTCKAYIDDIKNVLKESILGNHFKDNDKSFSIVYNHRNNNHLERDTVIKSVADLIEEIPGKHPVNLNNPDVSIVIEIIKNVALLAIVHNYVDMKKFNLLAYSSNEANLNDESCKKEND